MKKNRQVIYAMKHSRNQHDTCHLLFLRMMLHYLEKLCRLGETVTNDSHLVLLIAKVSLTKNISEMDDGSIKDINSTAPNVQKVKKST